VRLLFDILLGAGLAGAAGLRPFLPTLLAGGLASGNVGVDFDHTSFSFLESPAFLIVVALAAAVTIALERRWGGDRLERGPAGAALAGIALGLGALLFAGSLADDGYTWWPGLLGGLLVGLVAQAAARSLFGRVRARLDADARQALPVYAEGSSLLAAGASVLFPPLGVIVVGFEAWLAAAGRRRAGEKYAGLRILR
jgi:hypothetical protein